VEIPEQDIERLTEEAAEAEDDWRRATADFEHYFSGAGDDGRGRDWRRRGVARRLMRHAIDIATTVGASRLDVTASDYKVAARTLYRSLG
jgi:GNAT superfamily N-acetyltransferase